MTLTLTSLELLSCVAPLVALAANAVIHILHFRMTRGKSFLASGFTAMLAGMGLLFLMTAFLSDWQAPELPATQQLLFVHLPTYLALSYCYYNFAQLGQTSLRINLLRRLQIRPEGIPLAAFHEEHGDRRTIPLRITRLVATGDLIESEGVLRIGRRRFVWVGRILFALKRLLLGKHFHFPQPASPRSVASTKD